MKIKIEKKFTKDTNKLSSEVQLTIKKFLEELINADNLNQFDVKKMVGHKNAHRIRMGNYRIGIIDKGEYLSLVRVAKRDEIYKIFP